MTPYYPPISTQVTVEDDWTGLSNPRQRKLLQNRLNQRAYRNRQRRARLASIFHHAASTADGVQEPTPPESPSEPTIARSLHAYPRPLLDPVERHVILFARDVISPTFEPYLGEVDLPVPLHHLWFRQVFEVPIMRHCTIVTTCMDLQHLTGQDYTATRLRHVNATIQEVVRLMNVHMDDASSALADDILFAVMSLAKVTDARPHPIQVPSTASPDVFGLFRPSLQTLQSLHLWGRQTGSSLHLSALEHLVRLKGGLANISTLGFAEALHLYDTQQSAKSLTTPRFEMPRSCLNFLQRYVVPLRKSARFSVDKFEALGIPSQSPLLDILRDIRIYCDWIEPARSGDGIGDGNVADTGPASSSVPSTRNLIALRNLIEYRLLAYPPQDATEELCRTAILIFTHGVIFPLPDRAPLRVLVANLLQSVRDYDGADKAFLIWVTMMGALAADETDRGFFVDRFMSCATKLSLASWGDIKDILCKYLWLDGACEAGGTTIWSTASHPDTGIHALIHSPC